MVEVGDVIFGKLVPAQEAELQHKGLYRHPTWGVILPIGTDISGEQGKTIGEQYQKGQMANLTEMFYPLETEPVMTVKKEIIPPEKLPPPPFAPPATVEENYSLAGMNIGTGKLPYQTRGTITTPPTTYREVEIGGEKVPFTFMPSQQFESAFPGITGRTLAPVSGFQIAPIVPESASQETIYHEAGHYLTMPFLNQITGETKRKISEEGEKVLSLKYFGENIPYEKDEYALEATAITKSWLSMGGMKAKIIRAAAPETTKWVESLGGIKAPATSGVSANELVGGISPSTISAYGGTELKFMDIKESFWEKPLPSKIKSAFLDLSTEFSKVISLGGKLEYKPQKKVGLIGEQTPGIIHGGTMIYRLPTLAEMTPEQRAETKISREQLKYSLGEINEPRYREQITEIEKKYSSEVLTANIPLSFGKGTVFGIISVLAPPIGIVGGGLMAGETAFKWEEVKTQFVKYPKESWLNVGATITGGIIGGVGTSIILPRAVGFVRTFGKIPVAPETIIEPKVLLGEKTFPTTPYPSKELHYKIFKQSKYKLPGEAVINRLGVWHAAPESFVKETVIGKGTSELPGLYTAPSLSAYFLKITGGEYKLFGFQTESALKTPTAIRIYPTTIRKIPSGVDMKSFLFGTAKKGIAYVPGIKTEIEAVIPPKTPLIRISSKYYTTVKGMRVPINQYMAVEKKPPFGVLIETPKSLSSKYYGYGGKKYLFTSERISGSFSYKDIGYKVPSSFKLSYQFSYKDIGYKVPSSFKLSYQKTSYDILKPYYIRGYKAPQYYGKESYQPFNYKYDVPYKIPPYAPPYKPPKYPPNYPPITPPLIPPISPPPFIPVKGARKLKLKKEKFKRGYKYVPYIAALGLRGTKYAKGFEAPRIPTGTWTGIVTRPIIKSRRRKRR